MYSEYVTRKYRQAAVVFDGYKGSSKKGIAHLRRVGAKVGQQVNFTVKMMVTTRKDKCQANFTNKLNFIYILSEYRSEIGCQIHHAEIVADVLIVRTALDSEHNDNNCGWR